MTGQNVHGTAVAFGEYGVLIRGASGSGKSSLALRLIDQPGFGLGQTLLHAQLIADDQVLLAQGVDGISMSAPAALQNRIEVRGIGILAVNAKPSAKLHLLVDLLPHREIVRLPQETENYVDILGVYVRRIRLDGRDAGAPAALRAALFLGVAKQGGEA